MGFCMVAGWVQAQQWTTFQRFWETSSFEAIEDMVAANGGFIFVGETDTTPEGSYDALLGRLDYDGNLLWANRYGGTSFDYFTTVKPSASGGYLLLGRTNSIGNNGYEAWLAKADTSGNILWSMLYGAPTNDVPVDLIELPGGNIIIGLQATRPPNFTNLDFQFIKIDGATGAIIWTKTFGSDQAETLKSMKMVNSSELMGFGNYFNGVDYDWFVVKLDTNGNYDWSKRYITAENEYASMIGTAVFSNNVLLGGEIRGVDNDLFLMSIDPNGAVLAAKRFDSGEEDDLMDMRYKLLDGWYIATSFQDPNISGYNFGLLSLSPGLNYEWHNLYGYPGQDINRAMAFNPEKNGYLLAGYGSHDVPYEPSIQLVQTDSAGYAGGCNTATSTFSSSAVVVSTDIPWLVVTSLNVSSSAFLNVRKVAVPFRSAITCTSVGIAAPTPPAWEVHPNPAADQFRVTLPERTSVTLRLLDLAGKVVQQSAVPEGQAEAVLDVAALPAGMYVLQLQQQGELSTRRVIVAR